MFHFLLIPLPRTAVKMMDQITWKESFADHDLGSAQNVTPIMHLMNTPLLCRKNNSVGHSIEAATRRVM